MQCCAAIQAACRKQQNTPTLNGRGRWGEGLRCIVLDCFVLWSYTIWVHCLKSFVANCISNTPVFKHSWLFRVKNDFCESFDLSSYEQKNTTLIVGYYEQNNVRDKWVLTNAGYFRVDSSLCFKARLSEELLTDNNDFLFSCKWNSFLQEKFCTFSKFGKRINGLL